MKMIELLDERSGLAAAWRNFADRPWPGGPAVRHSLFAVVVYLFLHQAVLGVLLSMYYSPSSSDAWASTAYLTDIVELGWFMRGLHDHGASAFIIAVVAYVTSLVVFSGYRRPRELVWLAALGVLALGLAEGITGNPLPWDETGYWAIAVELGIAEQTPGGTIIRKFVQGGSQAGNFTLTRLFVLHAFVLPALLGGLMLFIAKQRNRVGVGNAPARGRTGTYAPGQLVLDMAAMTITAAALIAYTVSQHGTELMAPADPTSGFQARPEWYFLFLYKLRMYFEGPNEAIATMVIPGLAAGFLVAIPVMEAVAGKIGRVLALLGYASLLAGSIALTAVAIHDDRNDESYQKALKEATVQAERARKLAREGVVPEGGPAVFWNDPEFKVKQLYIEHCRNCHELDGFGGGEAPTLTDYSSRAWLSAVVRNPSDEKFFGKTKHTDMDAYGPDKLDDKQLAATVEFLASLTDDMDADAALAATGKKLWDDELDCSTCHEIEAGKGGDAPNLHGHGTLAWVERVIRDSSQEDLYGKAAQMPKFTGKLSDEEITNLAKFVVARRAPPVEDEGS